MNKLQATILLLVATFIWGTSFIAQDIAVNYLGSFMFNGIRSLLGFLVILIIIVYRNKWSFKNLFDKKTVKVAIICGIMLFAAVNFQQLGMGSYPDGVGASSRTAFITDIYVVVVTIVGMLKTKKFNVLIVTSVVLTMIGLYFVCIYGNTSGIYIGDLLVFACAIAFAVHIMYINRHSELDGIKISCIQLLVSGGLSLIIGLFIEDYSMNNIINCIGPILYTGILSSAIAYTIEVVALQTLNASVASVIMSSESPIALVSSAIVLGEKLQTHEYLGCFIVLVALILAQIPELTKALKNHT